MNEIKPKLAMVLSRFPLPLDKGDKLRAFEQLKQFTHSFEVHLFCLTDQKISPLHKDVLEELGVHLHLYFLPKWMSIFNVFLGFFNSLPLQVTYFKNSFILRKMERDIRLIQPKHIYCQLIRMTEYVKNMHDIPKTLDYMDALSKGIERRIESSSPFTKWLFRIENRRLLNYESNIFDYFENQTIISEQDRIEINHSKKEAILCIPNGVRNDFYEWAKNEVKYDAVFIGNLSYPPNIQAVQFIVQELLPFIQQKKPDFTFTAFGAQPHPILLKFQKYKGVKINGWVEDIRSAYASGQIFIAPMFIGTGLQNKLLEAMAMGIPCITTPLAGLPISAIDGENILLAKTTEDFVNQILKLDDLELRQKIINGAKTHVKANFDWSVVTQPLVDRMITF